MNASQCHSDTILCIFAAGKTAFNYVSLPELSTTALLPYNGRPIIYQIVLDFLNAGGNRVLVILPEKEERLVKFLNNVFSLRVELFYIKVISSEKNSIFNSLFTSYSVLKNIIKQSDGKLNLLMHYSDIYAGSSLYTKKYDKPTLLVWPSSKSEQYSHINQVENQLTYLEKGNINFDIKNTFTNIGIYFIEDLNFFISNLDKMTEAPLAKIMIDLYGDTLELDFVDDWIDLGHLDSSCQIATKLIGSRVFNTLSIDEDIGVITKKSINHEKILLELNYYLKLPPHLSIYFPRLNDFSLGKEVSYSIEYYAYKTLSEYFVYFELALEMWKQIFIKLLKINKSMAKVEGNTILDSSIANFYKEKLHKRLAMVEESDSLKALISLDALFVNGIKYHGWKTYSDKINQHIDACSITSSEAMIHGDFCFSNILYDPSSRVVKLIDPKGEFFTEGIFGDIRYDIAKLMHSVHGAYDFIIHDMYELSIIENNKYNFNIFIPNNIEQIQDVLLSEIKNNGYNIKDLVLMEAMLFLTMIPLHHDHVKRQIAFYFIALRLLKGIYDENLY